MHTLIEFAQALIIENSPLIISKENLLNKLRENP